VSESPRRQRIAAYALVTDDRDRVLLVLSGPETDDLWFLPGGGVEFGEDPLDGVRREVMEETGQPVGSLRLRSVLSDTSRRPEHELHSVRIIYDGQVDPDGDLRHEVDGTTVLARWVPRREALGLRLAPFVRRCLEGSLQA
jgi:8-oxo-dGTP diphosphatase